jgi:hypothetical protein
MWETEKDRADKLVNTFQYLTMTVDNWKLKPYMKPQIISRLVAMCNEDEKVVTVFVDFMYSL